MTLDINLGKFLFRVILCCGLVTGASFAAPPLKYASPMGDERWKMTGNPIRCGLSLVIPNYGVGYFEQYATKPPHFILRKWEQVNRRLPAQLVARSPVWKPAGPNFLIAKTSIRPGDYGIYLERASALKLLDFLSKGYQGSFNYRSEQGFDVAVILSPIKFRKVYSKYQRCLGGLLSFGLDKVKHNVLYFGVDSTELADADKEQLRRIEQYAAADVQIEKIRIVGYSDDTGRKGYNNAISQYRAEAVRNYLVKVGVPRTKIVITWKGVLNPVAPNDTEAGRAANRRVVIDLITR